MKAPQYIYTPPSSPEDMLVSLRAEGYQAVERTHTMAMREKLVGEGPTTDAGIKKSLREQEGVEKETAKQKAERITGSRYEVMTDDDPSATSLQGIEKELQTLNRTLGQVVGLLQDLQKRPRF
jgi:uncharacterized protein YjcR